MSTINFRISEGDKANLQILADERSEKVSVVVREIITNYLEHLDFSGNQEEIQTKENKSYKEFILYIPSETSSNS